MKELREHNENMLRNILPSHVARHFLEKDRDNEVSPGLSGREGGWRWAHWPRAPGEFCCPHVSTRERRPCYHPQSARLPRLPSAREVCAWPPRPRASHL